jgi:hypothetical protein
MLGVLEQARLTPPAEGLHHRRPGLGGLHEARDEEQRERHPANYAV